MRLDVYLTKDLNIQSRNKASELIKSSKVIVDGEIVSKPSFLIGDDSVVELLTSELYVSRAAYKLKHFLDDVDITIDGVSSLDIGSSTGGFAQILLRYGAKKVICVDVGTDQLHQSLKEDSRVVLHEKCDIRDFESDIKFELVSCDVSFISILNILDDIDRLSSDKIIILFKPQFEVGKDIKRDRAGVVLDESAISKAREIFIASSESLGWSLIESSPSKIKGKKGNSEEFFYFRK
jgi:23S rRNA (cytidine1920-2'-O)/16S rRNA (cytidine1409-2'-O)-methyltransferase